MNRDEVIIQRLDVPLRSHWARRSLRSGNYLKHVVQLLHAPTPNPFVVCMGPFDLLHDELLGLHCWLEAGDVAVDLTKKSKFWNRDNYYLRTRILTDDVHRYSLDQVENKMASGKCLTFWDFDVTKFVVYS